MYPNINESPVNEDVIKSSKAVFDAVYNPIDTKFISYARDKGLKYLNGISKFGKLLLLKRYGMMLNFQKRI